MHIDDYDRVRDLQDKRKEYLYQIKMLQDTVGDKWLGVTFQGTYQEHETCDAVRPALIALLTRRVYAVDTALNTLGVRTN